MNNIIQSQWAMHLPNIKSFTTLAFNSNNINDNGFNLATHVNDNIDNVNNNRNMLQSFIGDDINISNAWIAQTHGTYCINLDNIKKYKTQIIQADASFTSTVKQAAVVLTADCLPLLVTDKNTKAVLAIHAGWKGLLAGIIEKSIAYYMQQTNTQANDILVWLGPAIGMHAFEVGKEVKDAFINKINENCSYKKDIYHSAFFKHKSNPEKYHADIYKLAKLRIANIAGVPMLNITGGSFCTYFDARFYSYRRNSNAGRMASVIYITG
jgi:polyphenol oxidase